MMFLKLEEGGRVVHQNVGVEHEYLCIGAGIGQYYG
jgi:hypothetical protein